jgi:DNA-directed RNA polymerase I, II, and III subunit RPABC1
MSHDEDRVQKQREAGERESARLWRAWRTVHQMAEDRGYVLSEEELKISLDDFKAKYADIDGGIEYVSNWRFSSKHPTNFALAARD